MYEGQFDAGAYSGYGKCYGADGQLLYEGQYADGKRSGSGTAYADGQTLYAGQFMNDLYEGRGKLYLNGKLSYDGGFCAGVEEGTGTSYHPNGKTAYQGQFLAGKPDGTGTAYDETGRKKYTGGFEKGVYSGDGTLFLDDDSQLEAAFQNGEPAGSVVWKKSGILYYQGEWSDGAPSGFGTLYSKVGKKLYEGPFLGGTIDGRGLLAYSTAELRAAFCESVVKNENDKAAFRIVVEELGVTVLCTFQSESEESRVYQIYLSEPEKSDWVNLLPGTGRIAIVPWPEGTEPEKVTIRYVGELGVNAAAGTYAAENAVSDTYRTTVLYDAESREHAVLMTWARQDVTPGGNPMSVTSGGNSDVEKLLDALDAMIGTEGTATGAGAAFGGKSVDEALAKAADIAAATDLADAMLDFWKETERLQVLQEVSDRTDILLADAQDALAKGVGSPERVEALQRTQLELKAQIETTKTAIKRAELQASASGVTDPDAYAPEELLVSFDPGEQEVGELVLLAVAYAKATGSEASAEAIEKEVKTSLLNLSDAHSAAKLAMARSKALAKDTADALGDFSLGLGTKEAWYEAMNAEALARAELYRALAEFSKQANRFNLLTGGWVSRTFDWHKDVFEPLFRAAIPEDDAEEQDEDAAADSGEGENSEDGTNAPA